jgi:hypothetical protein
MPRREEVTREVSRIKLLANHWVQMRSGRSKRNGLFFKLARILRW